MRHGSRVVCVYSCAILVLASCTSLSRQDGRKPVTVGEISRLQLGTSGSNILQDLGRPGEEYDDKENGARGWLYFDPITKFQVALLSIDSTTETLGYKLVIPKESEPENSLAYVLDNSFKGVDFKQIEYPRCGKDYFRSEALLVNFEKGIVIEFRKNFKTVESISWSSPEGAKKATDAILNCNGRIGANRKGAF